MELLNDLTYKYNKAVRKYKPLFYPKATIVKPEECGSKVFVYMEECFETVQMTPTYSFITKGSFELYLPEIALWKFENGCLFGDSDMIILEGNKAIWPKYFNYNYNKSVVRDYNFIYEKSGELSYKRFKKQKHYGTVFSLLGKYSQTWAHALVEYYPKLSVLQNAISDSKDKITVLVPDYKDPQLREIIYEQLRKYDVNIEVIENGVTIVADTIYYMERPTKFTDHEFSVAIGDQYIPKKTVNVVREMLVEPHIKGTEIIPKYKKIFLPRRGGIGKGIVNGKEIEDYFEKEGFYFVEPHKVTFKDKIQIFRSAEVIVGPLGSAFSNLIFCRPNTKALIFSNYQRVFESYHSMPLQYYGIDILNVTGYDMKIQNPAHCSFYLPMEKVIAASKSFGIVND